MKYPATVIVVAIVVTIILMVKVVPVFQDLFASLSRFTCIYANGCEYVEMDAGILVHYDYCDWRSHCCLSGSKNAVKFRDGLDKLALKLPILGTWFIKQLLPAIAARLLQHLPQVFHLLMH